MDAMKEALDRKKQARVKIMVENPDDVELVGVDGKPFGGMETPSEEASEMDALAGDEGAEEAMEGEEQGPPSSEKDQRDNPDLAPGVYDKGEEEDEEPDMASEIFDKKEFTRRQDDGQTKPKGLTDRAGLAAFKGKKK